jgi:hypothetical protein
MATSPSRVAWDSCTWIAHIQRERIFGPDGKDMRHRHRRLAGGSDADDVGGLDRVSI